MDTDARFPKVDDVIPSPTGMATVCALEAADAAFLAQALPRLPVGADPDAPLTLDLDGTLTVRAKAEDQAQATELVLTRSAVSGPAVRLAGNRRYLARALALGCTEFRITKPDTPVLCRQGARTYVWMPLAVAQIAPPSDNVVRISSAGAAPVPPRPQPPRRPTVMSSSASNGQQSSPPSGSAPVPAANRTGLGALIEEAQSLQTALREIHARAGRLVAALKRHRRQSRLVQSTLASLKQLQKIDA
jgi:hypothetical protein